MFDALTRVLSALALTAPAFGAPPAPAPTQATVGGQASALTPIEGSFAALDHRGWSALSDPAQARAGAFVSPVYRTPTGGAAIATPTVFVRFEPGVGFARRARMLAPVGVEVDAGWRGLDGVCRVASPIRSGDQLLARVDALSRLPGVVWAEVDMLAEITPASLDAPNDPRFPEQWTLANTGQLGGTPGVDVRALDAWEITPGDPGVVTVVIDVGVDQAHPDLRLAPGMDFTDQPAPTPGAPGNACDNHGTWVAGRVSAIADNAVGLAGVAPGTRVASARIGISSLACNLSFGGQMSWTADAVLWAESIGARVTNNSNAYSVTSSLVRDAYDATRAAGMVHFSSAGNDGSSGVTYPASLGSVLAIGSIDRSGDLSFFSNYGSQLVVVAPGEDVVSTDRSGAPGKDPGDDAIVTGTSFASPVAAGVAALLFSLDPQLTGADAEDVLRTSARDLGVPGRDNEFGSGLVDARAALELAACWRSWSPAPVGPGPRSLAAMTYDDARSELVLFGGLNVFSSNRETWVSDGLSWSLAANTGPTARYGHAMVDDPSRDRVVLFGGFAGAAYSAETWAWNGSSWAALPGPAPGARFLHAMAYDQGVDGLVLFGGRNGAGLLGDTWVLDADGWRQITGPAPAPRDGHAITTDPVTGRAVLFGGSVGGDELWEFAGAGWSLVHAGGIAPRDRCALVADTHRGTLVVFGGRDSTADRLRSTYEWTGSAWALRSLAGPGERSDAAAAFHPLLGTFELLGGVLDGATVADAWSWRIDPPTITAQPHSPSLLPGDRLELSVSAAGVGPLTYRWTRDGAPVSDDPRVSGSDAPSLVIEPVRRADLGVYRVEVTDLCGTTLSAPVVVEMPARGRPTR